MKRTRAGRRWKPSPSTRATWTRPRTTRSKVSGACSGRPARPTTATSRMGDHGDPHVGTRLGSGRSSPGPRGRCPPRAGPARRGATVLPLGLPEPVDVRAGDAAPGRDGTGPGRRGRRARPLRPRHHRDRVRLLGPGLRSLSKPAVARPGRPQQPRDRDADAGPEGAGRRTGLHDRDGRLHGRTRRLPGGRPGPIPATRPTG